MNKKIRTILIIVLTLFSILGFKDKVFSAKWSNLSSEEKEKYEEFLSDDCAGAESNEVEAVCGYTFAQGHSEEGLEGEFYLFIYKDKTASFNYKNDSGIFSGLTGTPNGKNGVNCDGIKEGERGIRNWSPNKKFGNKANLNSNAPDAYSYYEKDESCPTFAAIHYCTFYPTFYLSSSDTFGNFKNIKNLAAADTKIYDCGAMFGLGDSYGLYNFSVSSSELPNMTENIECEYKSKDDVEENESAFKLSFDQSGNITSKVLSGIMYYGDKKLTIDDIKFNTSMKSVKFLSQLEDNKCPPTLTACDYFQDITDWEKRDIELQGDFSFDGSDFCDGDDDLIVFSCNSGDKCGNKPICSMYYEYEDNLRKLLEDYKKENKNVERRKILNDYNALKDELNSFCLAVLSYDNYDAGTCSNACIHIANTIANLETDAGLRSPYGNEKCNIGENVLFMVYNVLKWAKYIAPILVIVLSILDFIKALAAQSDDEMKKAQGKFIKRLVVAALLFLIPLIINFVLKTFGFYHSGCDITDLFSGSK